jgi:di/tricarboxylate transporter
VLAVVGIAFMVLLGQRLLPGAKMDTESGPQSITPLELARVYGLDDDVRLAAITAGSSLCDRKLRDADLRGSHGVTLLGIRRRDDEGEFVAERALPDLVLHEGDELRLLRHEDTAFDAVCDTLALRNMPNDGDHMLPDEDMLAELVLPRRSRFVGKTLKATAFRTRHRSTVLALQRSGQTLEGNLAEVALQAGDTLLLKGATKNIRLLEQSPRDFVVIAQTRPEGGVILDRKTVIPVAAITLGMLALMTFQLVPNVLAVLLAGIAMVLAGVLTTVDAYRRINWESVIVVAAILPMSTALDKTGSVAFVVEALTSGLGDAGPVAVMAVLFLVTSVASQVISNTATTVLVAPIAYQVATSLGFAPQPFLMAVALAASTAFATPVASPVNMLVLNAGGYRFTDFLKVGVPLQLVLFVVTLFVVPLLFPFA